MVEEANPQTRSEVPLTCTSVEPARSRSPTAWTGVEDGAPGHYNNFWVDRGTHRQYQANVLIVDPPNGRIP